MTTFADLERFGLSHHGKHWRTPMAKALGVRRQSLYNWEHGTPFPATAAATLALLQADKPAPEIVTVTVTVTEHVEIVPPALVDALRDFFRSIRGRDFDPDVIDRLKMLHVAYRNVVKT